MGTPIQSQGGISLPGPPSKATFGSHKMLCHHAVPPVSGDFFFSLVDFPLSICQTSYLLFIPLDSEVSRKEQGEISLCPLWTHLYLKKE